MEIVGFRDTRKTVVTGVEMFKKLLDQGEAGDNVGLLLRGIEKDDVDTCTPAPEQGGGGGGGHVDQSNSGRARMPDSCSKALACWYLPAVRGMASTARQNTFSRLICGFAAASFFALARNFCRHSASIACKSSMVSECIPETYQRTLAVSRGRSFLFPREKSALCFSARSIRRVLFERGESSPRRNRRRSWGSTPLSRQNAVFVQGLCLPRVGCQELFNRASRSRVQVSQSALRAIERTGSEGGLDLSVRRSRSYASASSNALWLIFLSWTAMFIGGIRLEPDAKVGQVE